MKIGYPNNPAKDLSGEIAWIGENGFDFLDLFIEEDKAVPELIDTKKIERQLSRYGLGIVGHTAYYIPVGSPFKTLRDASVREVKRALGIFARLGANYVTVHSNWAPGALFSLEKRIDYQVETLKRIVEVADSFGIRIMFEHGIGPDDSPENTKVILESVPELYLNLDTGHANLNGFRPADFINLMKEKIRHVHMSDNNRRDDLHLPLGCGTTDWRRDLKLLKTFYDGTITLEAFVSEKEYVLLARDKVRKAWESSNLDGAT